MNLQYPRYYCTNTMFLLVDNSDSPSIVEQSQQGCDSSCYTLLAVIPSSVKYPIPYACQLASCNLGISCCISLFLVSLCPYVPHVLLFCNSYYCYSPNWGSAAPFYSGCFLIEPWDSLPDLPGLQLGRCILGYLVWFVIGYPLLGVHPSVTLVKLIVIGYCCNCLDGQLNCLTSTHCLIVIS